MSIDLQRQIRMNGMDIRNYIEDLSNWQGEINIPSTKKKTKEPHSSNFTSFPIRGKVEKENQDLENLQANSKDLKRDTNTIKDYYSAWDKFDVVRTPFVYAFS